MSDTHSANKRMPRPCVVDGKPCTCHLLYVSCWTHGGGLMIGSLPAGQESMALALIERSDGSLAAVNALSVRFTDAKGDGSV